MLTVETNRGNTSGFRNCRLTRCTIFGRLDASDEEMTETDEADATLDDAARSERDYVRERLRGELKREPTESELDEWLRRHTEGY